MSKKNYKHKKHLRKLEGAGEWVYGINPVLEAIKAGRGIKSISISSSRYKKIPEIIKEVAKAGQSLEIKDINFFNKSFPKGHQGIAARVLSKDYIEIGELLKIPSKNNEPAFFIILDCIEDPRNLGAILRTAEAGGVHGIIIQSHRSAKIGPTVYKTSAGGAEHIPITRVSNIKQAIDALKNEGIWIYGAEAQGQSTLWDVDLRGSLAIVLGSEGSGIRKTVKEHCDYLIKIPLRGRTSSLNVSVAAGILIFEILRQRQEK